MKRQCPAQTALSAAMWKMRTCSLSQKLSPPAFPEILMEDHVSLLGEQVCIRFYSVPHGLTPARVVSPGCDIYLRHVACILERISYCSYSAATLKSNSFGCLGIDWVPGVCSVWRTVFVFKMNLVPCFLSACTWTYHLLFLPKSFH